MTKKDWLNELGRLSKETKNKDEYFFTLQGFSDWLEEQGSDEYARAARIMAVSRYCPVRSLSSNAILNPELARWDPESTHPEDQETKQISYDWRTEWKGVGVDGLLARIPDELRLGLLPPEGATSTWHADGWREYPSPEAAIEALLDTIVAVEKGKEEKKEKV